LLDPLHFEEAKSSEGEKKYDRLCRAKSDDWQSIKLKEIAQQLQEDWFAGWVGEMIRIAKPGAPVIVENIAPPYCKYRSDWGGVDKEFWSSAIGKYGLDIDPSSITFMQSVHSKQRYHAAMRKNGAIP
jgi:hypothetical protein